MKRSRRIRLILLGGLSAGALSSCSNSSGPVAVTADSVYANDDYIPGAGYYHAPFFAFYPQRFNAYDQQRKQYFYGGQWGPTPYPSVVNVSSPSVQAVSAAQAARTDIRRSGFGSSSRSSFISSGS